MTPSDPYKILGVDKKASQEEIKKAHRKLVRQYHPDHNPGDAKAEERFKEIQAAYDVVGDPDKRKQFDRGGMFGMGGRRRRRWWPVAAVSPRATSAASRTSSTTSSAARVRSHKPGAGTRGRSGAGPAGPRPERGADLESSVAISFEQAIAGAQIPLSVATTQPCPTCRGTGAKPGTSPKVCPKCQGRGIESQGQGLFSISQPCSRCHGSGAIIEDPCPTCQGAGQQKTVKNYKVNIPAGVREGSRVRLAGKGEAGRNGGPPGDLYVVTHVAPSPIFERKGDNLEVEVPLTIPEAIRGADVEVPTLNGRKKLRCRAGDQARHGSTSARRRSAEARVARARATCTTSSSSTSPRR